MNALIQVSDLKYDTNNGTILSVDIKIDSQSFHVEFKDHKYIVTGPKILIKRDTNPIVSDTIPIVTGLDAKPEAKSDAKPDAKPDAKSDAKSDDDAKPFKDNEELIGILISKGFTKANE